MSDTKPPSLLTSAMGRLRVIAFVEGISYVVLLFVAMPLKYAADMPLAVQVTGSVHGLLFVLFGLALVWVLAEGRLTLVRAAITFASSLVPFGTFVIDRHLRRWDLG